MKRARTTTLTVLEEMPIFATWTTRSSIHGLIVSSQHNYQPNLNIDIAESAFVPTQLVVRLVELDRWAKPLHVDNNILRIRCPSMPHRHSAVR